jgi:hypothetical protein
MTEKRKKTRNSNLGKERLSYISEIPLFHVNEFKNKFIELLKKEEGEIIENEEKYLTTIDLSEAFVPSAQEIIEDSITKQIQLDRENNNLIQTTRKRRRAEDEETPVTGDLENIPTYESIVNTYSTYLLSLTYFFSKKFREDGKLENGTMFPKKETNYIKPLFKTESNSSVKLVDENEVVLKVSIYHPEKNIKTQEFLVLGSQKLTELRDKLYCLADNMPFSKEVCSSYFYIENTFYNDMRSVSAIEYSQNVIEWAIQNKIVDSANLKSEKMENTCFSDLSLRNGFKLIFI